MAEVVPLNLAHPLVGHWRMWICQLYLLPNLILTYKIWQTGWMVWYRQRECVLRVVSKNDISCCWQWKLENIFSFISLSLSLTFSNPQLFITVMDKLRLEIRAMDEVNLKKKCKTWIIDRRKHLLNILFPIGPDPARPEGTDGNHEQNEQHASRLRG